MIWTLQRKLGLLFLSLSAIAVTLVGMRSYHVSEQALIQKIGEGLQRQAQTMANQVDRLTIGSPPLTVRSHRNKRNESPPSATSPLALSFNTPFLLSSSIISFVAFLLANLASTGSIPSPVLIVFSKKLQD